MTICEKCGEPFLDCCEDRTLCAKCLKKKVMAKVAEHEANSHPKYRGNNS